MTVLFIAFTLLVQAELLIHIIYHAATGKAGIEDAPFDYIKDIASHFTHEHRKAQTIEDKTNDEKR